MYSQSKNSAGCRMVNLCSQALIFLFLLTGCSRSWLISETNYFILYNGPDQPLPMETLVYLEGAEQSRITETIREAAAQIEGDTRRERMLEAVDYVWSHFTYDNREAHLSFTRTADQLFQTGVLSGCSDFALVQSVLFRALDIPARLVVTADVDWMEKYKRNNLYMTRGHVFIEVYLEHGWYLVDTAYRTFYFHYQVFQKSYPRNLFFCFRTIDYWEIGMRRVDDADRLLRAIAISFEPSQYRDPEYPMAAI